MRRLFVLVVAGSLLACSTPASAPEPPAAASVPSPGTTADGVEASPGEQARQSGEASPTAPLEAPPRSAPPPELGETARLCDDGRDNRPCVARIQGKCWFHGPCATPPCSPPVEVGCPDDLPLPTEACRRVEACVGVSDEGCCVGCNNPFRSRIATSCAPRIEAARDCAAVTAVARSPGCVQ